MLQVREGDLQAVLDIFAAAGVGDCTAVIGGPASSDRLRIRRGDQLLLDEARRELRDAWSQTSYRMQALRDHPDCAREEHTARLDDEDPGLWARPSFDIDEDVAAPFIATGARPRVAVLREQGVNSQVEMAAAFHRAGFEPEYFERARSLAATIRERFADPAGGGAFFETPPGSADLIVRTIETYDGVEPSGNAAVARLCLTLALYGDEPDVNRQAAEGIFRYCKTALSEQGASHSYLATALAAYLNPPPEICVILSANQAAGSSPNAGINPAGRTGETARVLQALSRVSGETITAVSDPGALPAAEKIVPLLQGRTALPASDQQPTIYVCRNLSCARPVHTADEMLALLDSTKLN